MEQKKKNKNEQLSCFLEFNQNLTKEEKELEAAVLAAETEKTDADSAFEKVLARTSKRNIPQRFLQIIIRVAAILTLPLLIYSLWDINHRLPNSGQTQQIAEQKFTSPVGMRSHVILPDGTTVWLNAESSLNYSVPFVRKSRTIILTGEAFLNVTENKNSPFIVKAANVEVEVTGTRFNIKAYPEENTIGVALEQGSVKLKAVNSQNKAGTVTMKAGDYFVVEKDTRNVKSLDADIHKKIAWHNNALVLDETPLEEVAVLLERWYGVKVEIKNEEIKKYKFSTTFENEPLNRVLELLELSSPGIEINYKPGKLNKMPGEKNYSVVTMSKT